MAILEEKEMGCDGAFKAAFFDCFLGKLKRTNVKKLKQSLLTATTEEQIKATEILNHNGNIKTLHNCLHNEIGLLFYLLLEEGYNLTEMSRAIAPALKCKKIKVARTSVQYWADQYFKFLRIIQRDENLTKGRSTCYQKKEEYSYLHRLIQEAASEILKEKKKKELRNSLPKELLDRDI